MFTRPGFIPTSRSQTPMGRQSISNLASPRFPTDCGIWLTGLRSTPAQMSVWSPQASTGNVLEKTCWATLAHPKYTKPQKGNKTNCKDSKWICDLYMCGMVKPSFIPPPDIFHLCNLMRYRTKLTNMLTGEKNCAQNCLTVSNLKLNDVFSDVFGKSSRSIIRYILEHPGERFDVVPFLDRRCKQLC